MLFFSCDCCWSCCRFAVSCSIVKSLKGEGHNITITLLFRVFILSLGRVLQQIVFQINDATTSWNKDWHLLPSTGIWLVTVEKYWFISQLSLKRISCISILPAVIYCKQVIVRADQLPSMSYFLLGHMLFCTLHNIDYHKTRIMNGKSHRQVNAWCMVENFLDEKCMVTFMWEFFLHNVFCCLAIQRYHFWWKYRKPNCSFTDKITEFQLKDGKRWKTWQKFFAFCDGSCTHNVQQRLKQSMFSSSSVCYFAYFQHFMY